MTQIAQSADEEGPLLESARGGSSDAMRELWRRHHGAARRYAASLTRRFDADDLVSEAFLRVFTALQNGGGPSGALRPYLYVTIRNTAARWGKLPGDRSLDDIDEPAYDADMGGSLVALANRDKLQEAMRALPEQWQQILWATEIQGRRPAELAQRFNLRPNSVAALSYRAREALKQAWVQAHVGDDLGSGEHRWVRERVGRYVCHALTPRQQTRFQGHVDGCGPCAAVVQDAGHLAVLPIGVSAILLLVGAAGTAALAPASAPASALAPPSTRPPRRVGRRLPRASFSAITATVTAATGIVAVGALASLTSAGPLETTGSSPVTTAPTTGVTSSPSEPPARPSDSAPDVPGSGRPEPSPSSPADMSTTPEPPGTPVVDTWPTRLPGEPAPAPAGPGRPSTVFTLSSIPAGGSGIAIMEVENAGTPLSQRTGGVTGSSAEFQAPEGVTFAAQDTLANDYEYAGTGRSTSAITFTGCTTDISGSTLRCDIGAVQDDPADPREWTWNPGDIRRVYVRVVVADGLPSGSLTGSSRLELRSTAGTRIFNGSWSVDVARAVSSDAPAVDWIDPTGDRIAVTGSAQPGSTVVVRGAAEDLGASTADDRGRWSVTLPWGTSGELTAEVD